MKLAVVFSELESEVVKLGFTLKIHCTKALHSMPMQAARQKYLDKKKAF